MKEAENINFFSHTSGSLGASVSVGGEWRGGD